MTNVIRETVYPVDFSIYATCPRAVEMDPPEVPVNLPIHYDSLAVRHVHGHVVEFRYLSKHCKILLKITKFNKKKKKEEHCLILS